VRTRALLVVALLGTVLVAAGSPATAGSGACAGFGPMARAGTVADDRVVELSGMAASRRHGGVLWAHNDSGGAAEVYALAGNGASLGAYPVTGAAATDWEDMAVGPGPGTGSYLFLGDIGDNGAERATVTVYRVPEPAAKPAGPGAALGGAAAIQLKYPAGPADAEALLVDPRSGDLVIVTKALSGTSRVLSASKASLQPGAVVTMSDRGTIKIPLPPNGGSGLPGTMVTGGDVSPDGSIVALRTYRSVLLYPRGGSGSVVDALKRAPCFGPQAEEPQGEAVAFSSDGASLMTASEGAHVPLYRSGPPVVRATTTTTRSSPVTTRGSATDTNASTTTADPSSTTTSTSTTTTTTSGADEVGDDDTASEASRPTSASSDDHDLRPLLLLIPIVLLAGALFYGWRRRRPSAGAK